MAAHHCECTECQWFAQLKIVKMLNFMLCIFYNFKMPPKLDEPRLSYISIIKKKKIKSSKSTYTGIKMLKCIDEGINQVIKWSYMFYGGLIHTHTHPDTCIEENVRKSTHSSISNTYL